MPIMNFVGNLGYVAVAIVGSIFAANGTITIGDIQAFIQYVKNFTQPIQQLRRCPTCCRAWPLPPSGFRVPERAGRGPDRRPGPPGRPRLHRRSGDLRPRQIRLHPG